MKKTDSMETYGLGEDNLAKIVEAIAQDTAIRRAVIYGSRAKGNYRANSDIDLTLEGDGLGITNLARLDGRLDDLLLPWQFDLSIKRRITNEALVMEIDKYGKVIYHKPGC